MNNPRLFHHPCEFDDVVRSVDVRAQRGFKRRVERDVAGPVDQHVGILHDLASLIFRHSEILIADIAVHRNDLVLYEILELIAVLFSQRIERWRRNNTSPKPRLRFVFIPSSYGCVHLPDIWKIMQQHRQRHLPDEPRPADKEDVFALKYFCW